MCRAALASAGLILGVLVWEASAALFANQVLFPSLTRIFGASLDWIQNGLLLKDLAESLPRALLAILIALPLGVLAGLALGLSPATESMFGGWLHFLRALPPVALLPLFILWFGIDWNAKVGAAAFVCLFPIAVTSVLGSRLAHEKYQELARDLRLSAFDYVGRIIFPAALPAIIPGLRLAIGTSFIMVFVSELGGASSGLGYRISISQLAFQADMMIAGLLVLGFAAWATDAVVVQASNRIIHYAGK